MGANVFRGCAGDGGGGFRGDFRRTLRAFEIRFHTFGFFVFVTACGTAYSSPQALNTWLSDATFMVNKPATLS